MADRLRLTMPLRELPQAMRSTATKRIWSSVAGIVFPLNSGYLHVYRLVSTRMRALVRDHSAQDQVEYAVFAAMVALAAIMALSELSSGLTETFERLAEAMEAAKNCANQNPGQFRGRSPCAP